MIHAGTSGALDDLPVEQCREFEKGLYDYIETMKPGVFKAIAEKKILDDALKADLSKVIGEYKQKFVAEHQTAATTA